MIKPPRKYPNSIENPLDEWVDEDAERTMLDTTSPGDMWVSYYDDGLRFHRHADDGTAALLFSVYKPWPWETVMEFEKDHVCLSQDALKLMIEALQRMLTGEEQRNDIENRPDSAGRA